MDQMQINQAEWENPENWGGPRWFSIYFSKRDSRVWVKKQIPWMGWTLNLAHTGGVLWFTLIFVAIVVGALLFCATTSAH